MDKKIFVLIAENDEIDRYLIEEFFREKYPNEIRFHSVVNGKELIDFLNTADILPDAILSDLNMPVINGFEALETIKKDERFKHIPYIISSTSTLEKDLKSTIALGADKYIRKPNTLNEYHLLYKAIVDLINKSPRK